MTGSISRMGETMWRGLRAALVLLALAVAPLSLNGPVRAGLAEPSLLPPQPALVGLVVEATGLKLADVKSPLPDVVPSQAVVMPDAGGAALPVALMREALWRVSPTFRPAARAPPEMMLFV